MKYWTDKDIVAWHKKAFPNATLESQVEKLNEELHELANSEKKENVAMIEEAADVIICCTALHFRFKCIFANYIRNTVFKALDEPNLLMLMIQCKMNENASRKWVEVKRGHYRHSEDK